MQSFVGPVETATNLSMPAVVAPDLCVQVEKVGDHRTQLCKRYWTNVAAATVVLDALNLGDGEQVALCDRVLVESVSVD